MIVKVDEWHAVATWTWGAEDDALAFADCPSMAAALIVRCLVTIAQLPLVTATTSFICTASSNGSIRKVRLSSDARCAAENGSSRAADELTLH
eukprot:CAMPEP_0172154886 /NCGR_PEP_ID=MMETSP1050-20130122/2298_1 /TAXON_ID=233186 /ORGANISM="Cryptomonas curvata, Strain CCAP979/52" /LENGTH=92 /DNA_ID=CAMNT_0012823681 /DNA_START=39 /DNA_END=318 /DNA_ORIENTATION=-